MDDQLLPPANGPEREPRSTAVLGLGPMGTALARALLGAGLPTTVWNRTTEKAEALRQEGAAVASSVAEAVRAADLVLVCLRDHDAVRTALSGDVPFGGRTVVNLSSATPVEARVTAEWFAERGITYLSGAIMVPTPLIGTPEALILYSGARSAFDKHADQLRVLAESSDYVGEDPGSAALHDIAMLEIFFAGMTSFLHAAAMVTAQGMTTAAFLPYAQLMATLLPETFAAMGAEVDTGSYPGTQDRVAMELAALEHIVATSRELGLDDGLPRAMRDLAARTVAAGHGEDAYTRLVETIRTPVPVPLQT
ncbi:MAG TPA: NAD(P)-binding domain-containing protein [Brevibacterium sp.]|nr:NAD(P)-binding domain-containing protein [Brevibacterium sp.]